jgi:hypothetical protein
MKEFSMASAMPMPPLTQRVARPRRAFRFSISWSSVTVMRVPVQPMGWPSAMAPPLTLSFSRSKCKFTIAGQYLGGEGFVEFDQIEVARA